MIPSSSPLAGPVPPGTPDGLTAETGSESGATFLERLSTVPDPESISGITGSTDADSEPGPALADRAAPEPTNGDAPARPPPPEPEPPPSPVRSAPSVGEPHAAGGGPAALAFARDPETERALREGLSEHPDLEVRPGGLEAAMTALAAGASVRLLFVDLDGTPYPAGAIHELAAVCEVGTVVIALGSNDTARFGREVLLAGVSDYLVKPVAPAAVREAATQGGGLAPAGTGGGWSVGFAGTGGSGATTLAAATALIAAERGRHVSVLDLDRTFSALSFLLDVEPAAGLVELLSTVARASLHPEMVDGMRAERSDRIAVYGYPWSAVPPPLPPVWAVCELVVELQRRSHLVLVDGLDDPATRMALLATVDARVVVVEPTPAGAGAATRLLARFDPMFEPGWPFFLVQNHTRAFKPKAGARALHDAGVEIAPDVVVPFDPGVPAATDRGWPGNRLPRPLRKPLAALADRILAGAESAVPARA